MAFFWSWVILTVAVLVCSVPAALMVTVASRASGSSFFRTATLILPLPASPEVAERVAQLLGEFGVDLVGDGSAVGGDCQVGRLYGQFRNDGLLAGDGQEGKAQKCDKLFHTQKWILVKVILNNCQIPA